MVRSAIRPMGVVVLLAAAMLCIHAVPSIGFGGEPSAAPLPAGVRAVWDLGGAYRQATPTRERVCLNGLWRWQPANGAGDAAPEGRWGYFKAPGSWPGITDYMQKDCQEVYAHPEWKKELAVRRQRRGGPEPRETVHAHCQRRATRG